MKFLPKFDPEKNNYPDDHIKNFMLSLHLMNVQHEDVVFWLLAYTFEGSYSTWYFNLQQGSITNRE